MFRQLQFVVICCHVLTLTIVQTQDEYVLTMAVSYNNNRFVINFPTDRFLDFYRCLCKLTTESCSAQTVAGRVTHIQELYFRPLRTRPEPTYNRYLCQHILYDNTVVCSKFQLSPSNCSITSNCYTYHFQGETSEICPFEPVAIIWIFTQLMEGSYIYDVLKIKQCKPTSCAVEYPHIIEIPESTTVTPTTSLKSMPSSIQNDFIKSTGTSINSASHHSTSPITNTVPHHIEKSTNSSTHKIDDIHQNPGNSNTKGTTIGLVISLVLVSLVLGLVAFIVCRRRKTSFLAKLIEPDSATDRSTPTLTQLHYIDSTYANISPRPAAASYVKQQEHNLTNHEMDDYFNYADFQGTEYEFDLSDYNDRKYETSVTDSREIDMSVYENYTMDEAGNLHRPDTYGKECGLTNICGDGKAHIPDEDLLYEDMECSVLENVYPPPQKNGDIENDHGIEDLGIVEDCQLQTERQCVKDSKKNLARSGKTQTLLLTVQRFLPSDERGHHEHKTSPSKLHANGTSLEDDTYKVAGKPLDNKELNSKPGKFKHSLARICKDQTDKIALSLSHNQPIRREKRDLMQSGDLWVNGKHTAEEQRHMNDPLPAEPGKPEFVGKNHEYFELEHASRSGGHAPV